MKSLLTSLVFVAASAYGQISIGIQIGPPPPPRVVQVLPARPGPEYVWVEGYWYPVGNHYKWHAGYWTLPVYGGARWVAPRYEGGRYFAGYWDGDHGRREHDHRWDRDRDRDWREHDRDHDWRDHDRDHGRDHDRH